MNMFWWENNEKSMFLKLLLTEECFQGTEGQGQPPQAN